MFFRDTAAPLESEVLAKFLKDLTATRVEMERGRYREARKRIRKWAVATRKAVGDIPMPPAGPLSAGHARDLAEALEAAGARHGATGGDLYTTLGALLDAVDFLAEQEEEREKRDKSTPK